MPPGSVILDVDVGVGIGIRVGSRWVGTTRGGHGCFGWDGITIRWIGESWAL